MQKIITSVLFSNIYVSFFFNVSSDPGHPLPASIF